MKQKIMLSVIAVAVCYVLVAQLLRDERPLAVEIDQPTPAFVVETLDKQPVTEQDIEGKGVVLNFWATYCIPCVKEIPLLEQAYEQGATILAINTGESTYKINYFLSKLNVSLPVLRDVNNEAENVFEVMALPTTYFIDAQGIVKKRVTGELTEQTLNEGLALINKE